MSTSGKIIRVTPEEMDAVLTKIEEERIKELAIVGPDLQISPNPDDWHESLPRINVYQLRCPMSSLIDRIAQFTWLELLALVRMELDFRSVEIIAKNLEHLKSLYIWSNNLGDNGVRIIAEHLGQLTSLNIWYNRVGEAGIIAIARNLRQLTSLDIGSNNIRDAGACVIAEQLPQLRFLDIGSNKVGNTGVCAIAENLCQLTSLRIWSNKLGEAGAIAIAKNLRQLTCLHIGSNKVGNIGASTLAEHLSELRSLDIGSNKVGNPGACAIAEHLPQLKSLDIESNNVGDSGACALAEHLPQLAFLHIGGNYVSDAGACAIAENLHQLTSLRIWSNKVGDLGARAIAEHLHQLTSLDIGFNKVGDAGAHAISEHLRQLTSLDIRNNNVGDHGARAIADHLHKLTYLNIQENKEIKNVEPFTRMPRLLTLNISETAVSDLSPFAGQIINGTSVHCEPFPYDPGIYVKDCPLKHPPKQIAIQGPEAVRNYFRELAAQGTDRLYEAKVLILGEGGAGKTSLLRRLYYPEMPLPTEEETTRGIDIHRHEFRMADGRPFWLNVWDFGGQQIYHATHQFFLTQSSLYILVDDTRTSDKSIHDKTFKYWLEVVETLTESSPLLIFQNEKCGRSKTIDEAGIKGRFSNFKETHHGDLLKNPESANDARKAIEYFVQNLPHVGTEVPAKWVAIRAAVEAASKIKPYITQDAYFELYARHLEFDRAKALLLSGYLHNLGVFLHFQDDAQLHKTVILQNEWATAAVFRILDDEIVKKKLGRFNSADCARLWQEAKYAEMHMELRRLMEKFELCYPLADSGQPIWLAPQLLSPSKPEELKKWPTASDLVVRYKYSFLPRGLVNRLMVRMHRFVKKLDWAWMTGAFFEHNGTQVLVEETESGNEIQLRGRGPEKEVLLCVLASDLEALNDSFKGLREKVGKWVPCICEQCQKEINPELYEHAQLVRRKAAGKMKIECNKSFLDVPVLELLEGLKMEYFPAWAQKPRPQNATEDDEIHGAENLNDVKVKASPKVKTIRIFLASSAELEKERDAFELYFRQLNDIFHKQGIYLQVDRWENFIDALSPTRLQDEYNQDIKKCDLFVSLFWTKAGKYTDEEFEVAYSQFKANRKPLVYTYFKDANISFTSAKQDDVKSLWAFQEKLKKLGHFYTVYKDTEHLKLLFRDQIDKLLDAGKL